MIENIVPVNFNDNESKNKENFIIKKETKLFKMDSSIKENKSDDTLDSKGETTNKKDYDMIIMQLTEDRNTLKRTFSSLKESDLSKKDKRYEKMIANDILNMNIRELTNSIEEIENDIEHLKKAHKETIDKLTKMNSDNKEQYIIEALREQLKNVKSDLYEANNMLKEIRSVAYALLPFKIADYCRLVEKRMGQLREKQAYLSYMKFKYKTDNVSFKRKIVYLKQSVESETKTNIVYEKQLTKAKEKLADESKRLTTLTTLLDNGTKKLKKRGYTMELALKRAKYFEERGLLKQENLDDPLNSKAQKRSVVLVKEKIEFLEGKNAELDKEIIVARHEYEKLRDAHQSMKDDVKDAYKTRQEIKKLTDMKEIMTTRLQQEILLRKTYFNEIEDLKGKIRVFCRCRPISKDELAKGSKQCVAFPDIYTVLVSGITKDRKPREFQFDRVYPPDSTQSDVFYDTNRLIQSAFDGFNVCIFAYGQTGSGKTHTLIGNLQNNPGIAPRTFTRIFDIAEDSKVKYTTDMKCYMLELYNEKLLDLMTNNADYSDKLEIKKDQHGMVVVPGAAIKEAKNEEELRDLFLTGNSNRHIASTKMNSESSRSHLVISIMITCSFHNSNKIIRGKISIIDLAGSERMTKSGVKGVNAQEAMSINMSLSALGDVISALTSGQPFVPYRNNKLTMLMQDSIGGNAKTLMFVNISPVDYNAMETGSSLTYAQRVKLIKNDATKVPDAEEVQKLQNIIEALLDGKDVKF